MIKNNIVLKINDLRTYFYTQRGIVKAVDGITISIPKGRILGLIGETGCGKSVTALSIMRLVEPPGRIIDGSIELDGVDLLKLSLDEMCEVRGKDVSMIFQHPHAALNPVLNIGNQIIEAIRAHSDLSKIEARNNAVEMLKKLGFPEPLQIIKRYPFELSGGMAQRVVIAIALTFKPKLLIADEPTSALDVTIQAQILELINKLILEIGTSVLFITHDLGVTSELCDDIAVLYAGKIVELKAKEDFYKAPKHPYTQGLLKAIPKKKRFGDLFQIRGEVPDMITPPRGCRFHPRCPFKMDRCEKEEPRLIKLNSTSEVACHLYSK